MIYVVDILINNNNTIINNHILKLSVLKYYLYNSVMGETNNML